MEQLIRLLIVAAIGYLALVVLMYLLQSRLVHLPHIPGRTLVTTPATLGLEYDSVELVTEDRIRLHGWFVPAEKARGTLLFFHGNAGNISHRLDSLQLFRQLGLNSFIIDYRGYGNSEGRPSEHGLYRDAEAAYHYLVESRDIPPERIVLFGRSLGAAVAARTARYYPAAGLIVESGFISAPELGADHYPFLPVRLLSRLQYDTRAHLVQSKVPVLVVHSRDDEIIPYRHGLALHSAAGERARLLTITGDHNTGFLRSGERYRQGLAAFLYEVLSES
ncbi:alpha/beta hydrolase [Thiohalomonas denitrificans]|uniref:Uncharacterized protein n=1 Tax=Thiohalomonas denitrificans TaxID=415747 RepID=A0A1G5QC16_9GAMM|nr:alpha/beta hydrolase [Thiohalomonas denitrificans]SCZ59344.1 hypothetical protein SAMN03097708_01844 [Thiohalomonas denitrificans]